MRALLCRRIASLLTMTVAFFCVVEYAGACDNPEMHPGSAEYVALVDSLKDQPQGAVQMMYKVGEFRLKNFPVQVHIRFWPIKPYDDAQLAVIPSAGLELVDFAGKMPIPYKGSIDFVVKPISNGFHYLEVEMSTVVGEEETHSIAVIPVSVGGHDMSKTGPPADKRSGFAGPRLKAMLPDVDRSP